MQSTEASQLAYEIGLRKLGPVIQRLMDAEAELVRLRVRLDSVEKGNPKVSPHLKTRETR